MNEGKLVITPKPMKGEDGYKTFSIRIKENILAEIESACEKTGYSRNQIISMFLEYALKNYEVRDKE